ncbi:hypothetical protein WGM54_04090 [Paenibacillus polymyxa]|uniref:hypothetical protein n=1 Tax=Paenibacillus polymyxa TaxID=1406 RepID=UPI000A89E72D
MTEIWNGYWDAARERDRKKYNSLGELLDFGSAGILRAIYEGHAERSKKQGKSLVLDKKY